MDPPAAQHEDEGEGGQSHRGPVPPSGVGEGGDGTGEDAAVGAGAEGGGQLGGEDDQCRAGGEADDHGLGHHEGEAPQPQGAQGDADQADDHGEESGEPDIAGAPERRQVAQGSEGEE